jgi:hypothetical protein
MIQCKSNKQTTTENSSTTAEVISSSNAFDHLDNKFLKKSRISSKRYHTISRQYECHLSWKRMKGSQVARELDISILDTSSLRIDYKQEN